MLSPHHAAPVLTQPCNVPHPTGVAASARTQQTIFIRAATTGLYEPGWSPEEMRSDMRVLEEKVESFLASVRASCKPKIISERHPTPGLQSFACLAMLALAKCLDICRAAQVPGPSAAHCCLNPCNRSPVLCPGTCRNVHA